MSNLKSPSGIQFLSFSLLIVLTTMSGCGDGRIPLGKVNGTVNIDGKPLAKGQIVFVTDSRRAFGSIEDGKIVEVTTYKSGDGVAIGKHQVSIRPKVDESAMMSLPSGKSPFSLDESVPEKYHKASTSELTAEISRGDNTLEFNLSSD
jgi:hypothetical protein